MTDKNMLTPDADALAERVNGGEEEPEWLARANTRVVVLQSQIDGWTQAVDLLTGRMVALEAELIAARETIADLHDLAYNRAPKIAAEEASKQKAEFEARLKEAEGTIAHLRNAKNCYYDCVDKAEANQRIANAENAALDIVRPMVEKAEAQAEAAEGLSVRLREIIVEHEKAAIRLMDEYDRAEANFAAERDAAIERAEKAEADAGRLRAIGEEAFSILADAHEDDGTGCRFQGAIDPHVFCIACLAQEKLADLSHAEQDGGKDRAGAAEHEEVKG